MLTIAFYCWYKICSLKAIKLIRFCYSLELSAVERLSRVKTGCYILLCCPFLKRRWMSVIVDVNVPFTQYSSEHVCIPSEWFLSHLSNKSSLPKLTKNLRITHLVCWYLFWWTEGWPLVSLRLVVTKTFCFVIGKMRDFEILKSGITWYCTLLLELSFSKSLIFSGGYTYIYTCCIEQLWSFLYVEQSCNALFSHANVLASAEDAWKN